MGPGKKSEKENKQIIDKESEDIFKDKEKLYENLVESLSEGVIVSDIYDRVLFVNKRMCELSGYSNDEIIGNYGYKLFFDQKDWGKILEKNRLRYANKSDRYEMELLRKDGSKFWASIIGAPFKTSSGEIIGTLGAVSDITEYKMAHKFLEKSEKKYRSVVEQVREVIFQTDAEGRFSFVNSFWTEITGYSYDETAGKYLMDYIHSEDKKHAINQFVNIIYQKKPYTRFTTRFTTKENEIRWVEINARMSYDDNNKITGTSGTIVDIHERKLAEEELIIAKEKAEESERLKSNFLAQMSHEIRSPLNIILSYSYLLKEEMQNRSGNEFDEAFGAIENSGKRLLRTIDLILNMAVLQTEKLNVKIKPVDLKPVLNSLVQEFSSLSKEKNLDLTLNIQTDSTKVLADEYSITHVFQNLIDNAVKYTKEGFVKVIIYSIDDKVGVDISDTGIGISEQYIKKLFEPFSQEEDGYARKFEGTGLGLSIAKKYIELNNAELNVQSKKGKGSVFTVILKKSNN